MSSGIVDQDVHNPKYGKAFQGLKNYILYNLGWPLIKIELTDEHLTVCCIEAVQKFYHYDAHDYGLEVVNVDDNNIVKIPSHISKRNIVDVIFEGDSINQGIGGLDSSTMKLGFVFPSDVQDSLLAEFDVAKYYLYLQELEDIKKVLQIHRHWDIVNDEIVLHPQEADFTQVGILYGKVPELKDCEQEPWIKKYSLGLAKIILGNVRRKLTSLQAGGSLQLDGAEQVSEGQAMVDKLDEELMTRMRPLPLMQL